MRRREGSRRAWDREIVRTIRSTAGVRQLRLIGSRSISREMRLIIRLGGLRSARTRAVRLASALRQEHPMRRADGAGLVTLRLRVRIVLVQHVGRVGQPAAVPIRAAGTGLEIRAAAQAPARTEARPPLQTEAIRRARIALIRDHPRLHGRTPAPTRLHEWRAKE